MTAIGQVFAEIYDAFAPDYERTRVPRFRPYVKKLLQLYDIRPKSSVLDAGTGTGLVATLIAPRVGHEGRVVGVDVSEGQLAIARQKARNFGFEQCEFCVGDLNWLEFPDGVFDLVVCSFALNGEPEPLFHEFHRVLKPGSGELLFQDWGEHAPAETSYDELFRQNRVGHPDERLGRYREARERLRSNWDTLVRPEDYEALLLRVGFSHAQGRTEVITQHFKSSRVYMEWRALEPVHRMELEAMEREARARLEQSAADVLRPFERETGLDIDWTAIQVIARA